MTPLRIFISSVQREFAEERAALREYLRGDPLMRRFFDAFLFEDVPATDRRPDELYLDEVERCDLYVGLFGRQYGTEDEEGISPTEREFDGAAAFGKHRLVFVKGGVDDTRHPKMQALIDRAQAELVRRRFNAPVDLVAGLYAALVEYLEARELLRWGPFDATPCAEAALDDLDRDRMAWFVGTARGARQFPLAEEAPAEALLEHLNLLNRGRLTNAAVLLFGKKPQRFLIASEVKCAHFHGTRVAKPIPSHQVYRGTVFELVDQAVDFVLGKIALSVGTRAESIQAPVAYEIPREVVTEAVVNAVAHRDYTSAGSVQVMLFADRLEIWNPGALPPPLTLDKLRVPHESVPGNPLLAARDVSGQVHRTDGDRDPRHDPTLRRGGPAGAGVRGGRQVRDPNMARGASRAAGRVHRQGRCAAQNEGERRVAARVTPSGIAARVAARVGAARVAARLAEDEGARVVGWWPAVEGGAVQPFGAEAGIRAAPRGGSGGSSPTG